MSTACFDNYESAKEHADIQAQKTKRIMAIVEGGYDFYVMTVRNAEKYALPHPDSVFIVYHAEPDPA